MDVSVLAGVYKHFKDPLQEPLKELFKHPLGSLGSGTRGRVLGFRDRICLVFRSGCSRPALRLFRFSTGLIIAYTILGVPY